jgi:flagellar biosynthetic protein FliR
MPAELTLSVSTLYGFLLVLARVGGALVFVPLPGIKQGPQAARAVMALALAVVLFPRWPVVDDTVSMGRLTGWLILDAGLGILFGVLVGFFAEAFQVMGQAVGLQAGFAYASMVDPQTQADTGVLLVFAQLTSGLLFFALGMDGVVVRAFARSLETFPPGHWIPASIAVDVLTRLGTGMFTTGLRLAFPALALLALVDLSLALLGRLNAQLQLLTLSFPLKMLAAVGVLALIAPLFPRVLGAYGHEISAALKAVVEHP